jgi:hypothetical protein
LTQDHRYLSHGSSDDSRPPHIGQDAARRPVRRRTPHLAVHQFVVLPMEKIAMATVVDEVCGP